MIPSIDTYGKKIVLVASQLGVRVASQLGVRDASQLSVRDASQLGVCLPVSSYDPRTTLGRPSDDLGRPFDKTKCVSNDRSDHDD